MTFSFAEGLQLDNKGNLLVADENAEIGIVPPPYTAIASTVKIPKRYPISSAIWYTK
jgi:hypothetical protein